MFTEEYRTQRNVPSYRGERTVLGPRGLVRSEDVQPQAVQKCHLLVHPHHPPEVTFRGQRLRRRYREEEHVEVLHEVHEEGGRLPLDARSTCPVTTVGVLQGPGESITPAQVFGPVGCAGLSGTEYGPTFPESLRTTP